MRFGLRNKKILLLVLALAAIIFFYAIEIRTQDESDLLQKFGLSNFTIIKKADEVENGLPFERVVASNGNYSVWIEHFKDVDAIKSNQYISEKKSSIDSIYTVLPAAYPDVVTRSLECSDKFRPIFNSSDQGNQESFVYILYANNRFTYGACSDDTAKYREIFYIAYCKDTKELYQIEYFVPKEEFSQVFVDKISGFRCG